MKIFLLLLLSFFSHLANAGAQGRRGALQVKLTDNRPLKVVVNGRDYERKGSSITIGDLPQGRHSIQVFAMRGRNLQNPELVYRGKVRVQEGTVTLVSVDPTRHSARVQVQDGLADGNAAPGYRDGSGRLDEADDRMGGNRGDRRGNTWLTDTDLEDLRRRTADRTADADKLQLIQSVIAGRTYSTAQVRAMAGMLSFESTKLELAKSAYARVSDPRDYWKLEDIFTFDASKQELTAHINGGR